MGLLCVLRFVVGFLGLLCSVFGFSGFRIVFVFDLLVWMVCWVLGLSIFFYFVCLVGYVVVFVAELLFLGFRG